VISLGKARLIPRCLQKIVPAKSHVEEIAMTATEFELLGELEDELEEEALEFEPFFPRIPFFPWRGDCSGWGARPAKFQQCRCQTPYPPGAWKGAHRSAHKPDQQPYRLAS